MKPGLKLWSSNADMIPKALKLIEPDKFQYIELTPVPGTEIKPWLNLGVPFIIHATTERHGFNIGENNPKNMKLLKNSINWANELDAEYIVLHPGYGKLTSVLEFLEDIDNSKILIENMPKVGINNEKMLGFDRKQLAQLIGNKFGFCLDVNHAMKAAISLKINGLEFIRHLNILNPKMYHIADGTLSNEKDEHLHIGQGDYDLLGIMDIIGKSDKPITLETPRGRLDDDLRNLKDLRLFF